VRIADSLLGHIPWIDAVELIAIDVHRVNPTSLWIEAAVVESLSVRLIASGPSDCD
jgi:hypothetical protein